MLLLDRYPIMLQKADLSGFVTGEPFDVKIILTEFKENKECGSIEHIALKCRGTLKCKQREDNTYYAVQEIKFGRAHCLGGLNRLTFIDSNTL